MTTRERFHAVMDSQPFDRLPLLEWASWWDKTIQRWHGEGLPPDLVDRYAICTPDFMTFGEDMSYNNGPMLSKELFDEFMRPYYDRVVPALRRHGVIPVIDSDGDIAIPAHWFADGGQGRIPGQLRPPDSSGRVLRGLPVLSGVVPGICGEGRPDVAGMVFGPLNYFHLIF